MKQRLYLDTSIISALHDVRTPERREQTLAFWARLFEFEVSTSEVTRQEIEATPHPQRRDALLDSLALISIIPVSPAAESLAAKYLTAGVFSSTQESDALHVAVAVITRHDILVSWNFKHLVNRRRRALVNAIGLSVGAAMIEIVAPPEV